MLAVVKKEEKAVAASQLLSDLRPELLSHRGPGFSENLPLAVNKAKVASLPVSYIVTKNQVLSPNFYFLSLLWMNRLKSILKFGRVFPLNIEEIYAGELMQSFPIFYEVGHYE